MKISKPSRYWPVAFLILGVTSCDIVEKDATPANSQKIIMLTAPNKSAVIDLQQAFPDYSTAQVPDGNSKLKYFGDRYVKYNLGGTTKESFNFSVVSKSGLKTSASVNVNPLSATLNCNEGQAFEYARIHQNTKLVVNLFNNPEFCDFDINGPSAIAVAEKRPGDVYQNTEGALIALCACQGNTAIFTYDPPKDFVGQVKFKYYLGFVKKGVQLEYPNGYYNPDNFERFSIHEVLIDVVDDDKVE